MQPQRPDDADAVDPETEFADWNDAAHQRAVVLAADRSHARRAAVSQPAALVDSLVRQGGEILARLPRGPSARELIVVRTTAELPMPARSGRTTSVRVDLVEVARSGRIAGRTQLRRSEFMQIAKLLEELWKATT